MRQLLRGLNMTGRYLMGGCPCLFFEPHSRFFLLCSLLCTKRAEEEEPTIPFRISSSPSFILPYPLSTLVLFPQVACGTAVTGLRTQGSSVPRDPWLQIEKILKVKRDKGKDKSDIDKWFELWEVLFPNVPTPVHPCEYMSEASFVACR